MKNSSRCFQVRALCTVVALGLALPMLAQTKETKESKDEKKRLKEMQEAMQREARPVLMVINDQQKQQGSGDAQVFTVKPGENDPAKAITPAAPAVDAKAFQWHYDKMKAADGKVYVPYTLTVPADALPAGPLSVYLRVVEKGATPPPEPKGGDQGEQKPPDYPFEDFFSVEARAAPGQGGRVTRAFAAPPGDYDVYIGMRPKLVDARKGKDDPVRVVGVKHGVSLPNFWNGELTTSSVVVTGKVEQVQEKVTPEMQRERPYLFGQTEFMPSFDNKFKKGEELSVVFQIYNPTLQGGKPNVTVEYSFHQKLAEGEKYFNKTNPQTLDAQTLPPTFDVASTQMLPGGQSVPLASFPPGDYRMEIKIKDGHANKTITRDVVFTVLGV